MGCYGYWEVETVLVQEKMPRWRRLVFKVLAGTSYSYVAEGRGTREERDDSGRKNVKRGDGEGVLHI